MCSPGINGEGELRRQLANPGLPGKMAVKTECVCVFLFSGLAGSMCSTECHSNNYYRQSLIYICRHADELKKEAKAHVLNHVNIVTLYAMIFEHLHYGLVLEFVPLGCLEEFIYIYQVLFASVKNVIFMIYHHMQSFWFMIKCYYGLIILSLF